MHSTLTRLFLAALLAASPMAAAAQTTTTEAETTAETGSETEAPTTEGETATQDPTGFNTGQTIETQAGTVYVREEFTDWQIRCVRRQDGVETDNDPCQLYQLLRDQQQNAVAEISIVGLPDAPGGTVAGATIITPLETLLTERLTMRVDSGKAKRYPFNWCTQIGCFSRVGFTADEISGFKRGSKAEISIVPVAAPDQRVVLTVSLSGFTAGYDGMVAHNAALKN